MSKKMTKEQRNIAIGIIIILCFILASSIFSAINESQHSILTYFMYVIFENTILSVGITSTFVSLLSYALHFINNIKLSIKNNIIILIAFIIISTGINLFSPAADDLAGVVIHDVYGVRNIDYYNALLSDIVNHDEILETIDKDTLDVYMTTTETHFRGRHVYYHYFISFDTREGIHYTIPETERISILFNKLIDSEYPVTLSFYKNSGYLVSIDGVTL